MQLNLQYFQASWLVFGSPLNKESSTLRHHPRDEMKVTVAGYLRSDLHAYDIRRKGEGGI